MVINMRCSYCSKEALFKCGCPKSFMCGNHLDEHLKTFGEHEEHECETSKRLGQPRLQNLRLAITKRIQNINESENLILSKTRSLIKSIEDVQKGAIKRLNASREECFEILQNSNFFDYELPKIEKIEAGGLDIKLIEIDDILAKTENVFGAEFTNYMENRIVKEK